MRRSKGDLPSFDRVNPWGLSLDTDPDITMRKIINQYADRYGVTFDALVGPSRTQRLTHIRHLAMHACFQRDLWSLVAIGKRFGGRDHTTVLGAVRKIEGRLRP